MPNQSIGISAVEPKYQEERYVKPLSRLARQPSTFSDDDDVEDTQEFDSEWEDSMSDEGFSQGEVDDGSGPFARQSASQTPFGDGSGPFARQHTSQKASLFFPRRK